MNPENKVGGNVAHARRALEEVRRHLLTPTPQAIAACEAPLRWAAGCMEQLQSELRRVHSRDRIERSADTSLKRLGEEVARLRRDLREVSLLLEGAARFWEGYGRLLGAGDATPPLDYAPVRRNSRAPERRLLLHG